MSPPCSLMKSRTLARPCLVHMMFEDPAQPDLLFKRYRYTLDDALFVSTNSPPVHFPVALLGNFITNGPDPPRWLCIHTMSASAGNLCARSS